MKIQMTLVLQGSPEALQKIVAESRAMVLKQEVLDDGVVMVGVGVDWDAVASDNNAAIELAVAALESKGGNS